MEAEDTVFRALADPTRRAILEELRLGPKAVQEIVQTFSISRPAISRHLRLLRFAELVQERKQGRKRVFQIEIRPLREVDRWLQDFRLLMNRKV